MAHQLDFIKDLWFFKNLCSWSLWAINGILLLSQSKKS